MLHVVNLDLLRAGVRHHPDGQPKDPHEHHRRDHILRLRLTRGHAFRALLRAIFGARIHPLPALQPQTGLTQAPHP